MNKNKIVKYIHYLSDHVDEIKLKHRRELLQIILCSNINNDKIIEKGVGSEIKFSDIDDDTLEKLYNYLKNIIENSHI